MELLVGRHVLAALRFGSLVGGRSHGAGHQLHAGSEQQPEQEAAAVRPSAQCAPPRSCPPPSSGWGLVVAASTKMGESITILQREEGCVFMDQIRSLGERRIDKKGCRGTFALCLDGSKSEEKTRRILDSLLVTNFLDDRHLGNFR